MASSSTSTGAERILYASEYPLALAERFTAAIETSPLSAADRAKIFHGNARKLLRI
jgi:predicted TIM-barrel fold metal-dependent hydrolase